MSDSPILQCPEGCDECGRPFALMARTVIGLICPTCYRARGQPMGASLGPLHEMEERTRERMIARGAATAHLVRKGLT